MNKSWQSYLDRGYSTEVTSEYVCLYLNKILIKKFPFRGITLKIILDYIEIFEEFEV